jgi:hypothetical protein
MTVDPKKILGWHILYWSEGQLKVCFRPGGKFFAMKEEHQAAATWKILDGEVFVEWEKFGRYVFTVDEGQPVFTLKGYATPKNDEDVKNWRKCIYFGSMSPLELMLCGDGEGTEWDFESPEGHFSVEFRCDGNNHVICRTHAGDAHWSLDKRGKTILVDWGKLGKYELDVDLKNKKLDGYLIRPDVEDPDEDKDWRKAEFKRNLTEPMVLNIAEADGDDDETNGHGHEHGHGHTHGEGHGSHEFGAGIVSIGNLSIGSNKFMVDREQQVDKGFETTFGFEGIGEATVTGAKAWLQDSKGERISEMVEGDTHGAHLHFTVMPTAPDAQKLAVGIGDQVSTISVHPGAAPAQDGILSPLFDDKDVLVGFIELKLHDDAGDLELWLCKDGAMSEPLDFPADLSVTATFATMDNRSVTLSVRNNEDNEDEDGTKNMRDGKTNYFIFPGESDQDPEFLIGEKFRSTTTITFTSGGKTYTAPPFILVPHQH